MGNRGGEKGIGEGGKGAREGGRGNEKEDEGGGRGRGFQDSRQLPGALECILTKGHKRKRRNCFKGGKKVFAEKHFATHYNSLFRKRKYHGQEKYTVYLGVGGLNLFYKTNPPKRKRSQSYTEATSS